MLVQVPDTMKRKEMHSMTGETRRQRLMEKLQNSEVLLGGAALAKEFKVSRQVIVQDIALLRAAGYEIESTNRGYRFLNQAAGKTITSDISREERLQKQFAFCREIDKEKFIKRQTYLTDGIQKENDAEHAWHMAVMTLLLSEYANEEIDVLKTISMLLIHDLVEIDAGDTYAYDEEGKKTQRQRELQAAERIFGILPEDQCRYFRGLWDEFEAQQTKEAKFARTMDNIQPMMLNSASEGKAWQERGICLSQILNRNKNTSAGSEILWEYAYHTFLEPNVKRGRIKDE